MTRVRYEQLHRDGVRVDPNWYKVRECVLQGYHVELKFCDLKTEVLAEGCEMRCHVPNAPRCDVFLQAFFHLFFDASPGLYKCRESLFDTTACWICPSLLTLNISYFFDFRVVPVH